jgi:hypothetical protein
MKALKAAPVTPTSMSRAPCSMPAVASENTWAIQAVTCTQGS